MNNIRGLDALKRKMAETERDAARKVARALTRAAYKTAEDVRQGMPAFLLAPSRWTLNSLRVLPATSTTLTARVKFKDGVLGTSTPAAEYLHPQAMGGGRRLQPFEKALISGGHRPVGYFTAPGPGASIDLNGNVRVMSQDVV